MQHPTSTSRDTILFIDDEAKARKYFVMLFGRKRKVITAEDGREGLDMFLQHRNEIGLVITDHIMPRMTGLELLEQLQAEKIEVPRVLSTAYTDSDLVQAAVSGGLIDYFIGKPWDMEKFESIVQQSFALRDHRLPVEKAC